MLQSLKLCADKLMEATNNMVDNHNNIATNSAATTNPILPTLATSTALLPTVPHAAGIAAVTTVSFHSNGSSAYPDYSSSNNNNNNNHIANKNNNTKNITDNLNNLHHLQQYQAKYLEPANEGTAVSAATINATTVKTFHPYLRPVSKTTLSPSSSSFPLSTATISSPTALIQTLLQNQINSTVVKTTTSASSRPAELSGGYKKSAANTLATTASSGLLTVPAIAQSSATSLVNNNNNNTNINSDNKNKHSVESQCSQINPLVENSNDLESTLKKMETVTDSSLALVPCLYSREFSADSDDNLDLMRKNIDELSKDKPDADTIKMFVGQVPKSWDEIKLRSLFDQYGRVHTLNVLRDKVTMASRGCCFVTYYTRKAALRAQDALHNIKILDGMHHPIQMKPADSENRNERKLFVGMLNKKYNEADVRDLFAGHGTIDECTVLRDQNGQSKGCAFVTFDTKQHAIGAIKALHHSQTMEGCSAPLVVKFADTQREKDQKKLQQLQVGLCGITTLATAPSQTAGIGTLTAPSTASTALSPTMALVPTPVAASARTNPTIASLHAAIAAPSPALSTATGAAAGVGIIPTSAAATVSAATPSMLPTAVSATHQQTSPYLTTTDTMIPNSAVAAAAAQMQIFQQLQAFGLQPTHYLQGLNFPLDHSTTAASLSASAAANSNSCASNGLLATPIPMQKLVTLASLNASAAQTGHVTQGDTSHHHNVATSQALAFNAVQAHHFHHHQQQQQQQQHQANMMHLTTAHHMSVAGATPPVLGAHFVPGSAAQHHALWSGTETLTSPYATPLNPLATGTYAAATAPLAASAIQVAAAGVAGKQIEGPDGSNLFIYHLPQEFTDIDLASTFLPFGNVLSAKVFIDKQSNLSKCFGFVSYDNPVSASEAIRAMHGFQIGTKRLKVQLKRSKDAAKPY